MRSNGKIEAWIIIVHESLYFFSEIIISLKKYSDYFCGKTIIFDEGMIKMRENRGVLWTIIIHILIFSIEVCISSKEKLTKHER